MKAGKIHNTCMSACQYAKEMKRAWSNKPRKDRNDILVPMKPGQVISVGQLVSPTPGLIW